MGQSSYLGQNNDISPEEYCPKCKNQVKTSGVWCVKCNKWWYFKCDKTNSKEVEQKFGETDYICKLHEEREKLNDLKEKLIHRDDIITQLNNEIKLSKEQNNSNKDQIDNKDQ